VKVAAQFGWPIVPVVCLAILTWLCLPAAGQTSFGPHEQFLEAQRIQQALEQRPESGRTIQGYQLAVAAYRKVYFDTPGAQDATRALMQIGALYEEMGARFDKKYFHAAIVSYDFLLRGYPDSPLRSEASFAIAQIEQKKLHARHDAEVSYRDFLQQFPDSPRVAEARAALTELHRDSRGPQGDDQEPVAEQPAAKKVVAAQPVSSRVDAQVPVRKNPQAANQSAGQWQSFSAPTPPVNGDDSPAQVSAVHSWNGVGHTRVVVSVDRPVKFEAGRAHNPERIFFDIDDAHVAADLATKPIAVNDLRLKTIRLAQNRHDVVRVVLDVNQASNCAAYLLRDPDRLVIDVQDAGASGLTVADSIEPDTYPGSDSAGPAPASHAGSDLESERASSLYGSSPVKTGAEKADSNVSAPNGGDSAESDTDEPAALSAKYAVPTGPSIPQPLHGGNRSLTRELGLKINRIVIDPGHGGHDTGTIGPHGIMEKTVCLDVALRLGRLIQKRLPSAEVVYTRKDDTFVPLEERTAIANREKADLFISIHANSSPSESARGVETYYLNFATSPDAMEVATRENAVGASSVHELQSMIQKIARNEKLDESREFAADVQQSLYHRLETGSRGMEDRGVKRAPFVVLIGAQMPSILSEIAFLSNTTDEKLLSSTAQRQRVAEGLYHGVESYLASLNSLAVNTPGPGPKDRLLARGNQR
jgi:N-acetylmuramoyl-L-alanine amidase